MTFGERLRLLRQQKGLSQRQLARRMFVEQKTINNYENKGRLPTVQHLLRLCDALEVSADWLLGRAL